LKPHRTREKVANSLSYILPLHLRGPGIPNVRYSRVDHPMGDAVTITMTRPSHKVAEPFKGEKISTLTRYSLLHSVHYDQHHFQRP